MATKEDLSGDAYLTNVTPLEDAAIRDSISQLLMLAEPINGPNSFNLETAAYGYITLHEKLVVPLAYKERIPETIVPETDFNILELLNIAFYNFIRLKQGQYADDVALFVALYRARLIKLGYLLRSKENRHVTVDEVTYAEKAKDFHGVDYADAKVPQYKAAYDAAQHDGERLKAYVDRGTNDAFKRFLMFVFKNYNVYAYVTLTATQYAAATYLVFRQHGHHYTQELDGKYNTLWRATTIESKPFVPSNSIIHRVAIHSFGVYTLHKKFFYLRSVGLLAETYMDRSDVAPCGTAVVATCQATMNLMKSLPVWTAIYATYKHLLDHLAKEAEQLKDPESAIKFHKNAKLFGETRHSLDVSSATSLAPVAKGFIDLMGNRSDMFKQKALDKRAAQNPIVVQMVADVLGVVLDKVTGSGDFAKAVSTTQQKVITEGEGE